MGTKKWTTEKILCRALVILSITGLVVASIIILSNQRLPTRAYAFVRSLAAGGDDVLASETSESDINSEFDYDEIRLPGDVVPKAYDLSIATNLSTLTFSGDVEITVSCVRSTQHIILHAKNLNILSTNVSHGNTGKQLRIQQISSNPKYDHYIIELGKTLKKHRDYVINMKYTANISKTLNGFYKSYYTTGLGEKRPLVVTHFEPTNARKAFPCFDEPAMKATFTLHLSRDPTHQSLSNMVRDHQEDKSVDLVMDHYKTSPLMSTYLLSFMVLDFDYQETETPSGVRVCVYAPPEDKIQLKFALDVASKTLSFFEKLLGVPFPLRKLDLVAVPDFKSSGMEEWGLISIRREFLVYDEKYVGALGKQKLMKVITHEIAHMWFGDLVGIKWWDDAWLKEGFATFFSYLACYNLDKETDSLAISVLDSWQRALDVDGKSHVHSLVNEVQTPTEIESFFDAISYNKGAMILKMLMNTIGNGAFLKGIRMFLEKAKYGNVDTSDLWTSLSQVGKHLDLARLMKSWTDQRSFPIVTLKRLSGPEIDIILAEQESFLEHKVTKDLGKTHGNKTGDQIENNVKQQSFSSSPWHIPLTYTVQSTAFKEYTVWLDKKWEKLSVLDPRGWIKANVRASGYYVVNYDKKNWIKLIKQLKNYHVVFSPSDRAGLIHDSFVLACEGLLDASIALKLVLYMPKEEHYVPMAMLREKSKCLEPLFEKRNLTKLYSDYLWYLQEHMVNKVGMKDKGGLLEQINRYSTLSYAVKHRPDIKKKFVKIFQKLRDSKDQRIMPKGLTSNFRLLAFSLGVDKSSAQDWEYLWNVYQTSPYDSDRRFLISVLASFKDEVLFNKNLQNSLDLGKVRSQDSLEWLSDIKSKTSGKNQIGLFLDENRNTLNERFGTSSKLTHLLKNVEKKTKKEQDPAKAEPFVGITKATRWLERYMEKVKKARQMEKNY